ncbi:MAG: calcium-binding protein [Curvibacter sp.]|nr:MAG: calcium-binding protein [Curvibacter sp.]
MTSLSTVSSTSQGWAQTMPPRPSGGGRLAERLLSEFDADDSGSVDSTELQSLLSDVSQKTGISTSSTSATDLLAASDSNGDGSLSATELGKALKSVLPPPPSTLDFVQSRSSTSQGAASSATGQAGDDLFSQLDTNGDSSVSQDELQTLLDQMASDQGNSSSALSASDVISQLDTNGDGSLSASELDAARPQGQDGPPPGGMPPPPALSDSSLGSSSGTNGSEDPLQALFNAIDSDQSGDISSTEAQTFLSQLASQLDSSTVTSSAASNGASSDSSGTGSDSSNSSQDLVQLVQAARREYQAHMHGWSGIGGQLSASA